MICNTEYNKICKYTLKLLSLRLEVSYQDRLLNV